MEFISLVFTTRNRIVSSKYNEDNYCSDDSCGGLYEPFVDRSTRTNTTIEHNEEDEDRDEETSRRSSGSSISSILSGLSDQSSSIRNKADYVSLYVSWRLSRDTGKQLEALKSGLFEIVPSSFLSIFDSRELELVLCGLASIDVDDWERNTKYGHLTADTELVTWFWSIVRSMDDVNRARLLQFCTGTSRVPVAGFKNLRGATNKDSNSVRRFSIVLVEGPPALFPKAHTCFNRLDIPIYESREQFAEKLHFAINETMGFHDK